MLRRVHMSRHHTVLLHPEAVYVVFESQTRWKKGRESERVVVTRNTAVDPPVLLRDNTAATQASDYNELLRQRIKFLVVEQILTEADRYIGQSSTDGLQLTAMQTDLDSALSNMQKRGYISKYSYTVSTTDADQRVGRAFIDVSFRPADELVQLRATVGIQQ